MTGGADRPGATPVPAGEEASSTVVRFPGRTARSRRLTRWGIGAALTAALGLLAWVLFLSPVLAVDRVQVSGTRLVDRAAVEQRLEPLKGVPLPRVHTARVEELLADVPGIDSVRSSALPPTGVEVQVQELAPVASWARGAGVDLLLADGTVLTGVAPELVADAGLPAADDALRGADPAVRAGAAAVLSSLPDAVRRHVTGVAATAPEQVRLAMDDDTVLVWGDASRTDLKAGVAEAFLRRGGSGPTLGPQREIDVSVPDRPITR